MYNLGNLVSFSSLLYLAESEALFGVYPVPVPVPGIVVFRNLYPKSSKSVVFVDTNPSLISVNISLLVVSYPPVKSKY